MGRSDKSRGRRCPAATLGGEEDVEEPDLSKFSMARTAWRGLASLGKKRSCEEARIDEDHRRHTIAVRGSIVTGVPVLCQFVDSLRVQIVRTAVRAGWEYLSFERVTTHLAHWAASPKALEIT